MKNKLIALALSFVFIAPCFAEEYKLPSPTKGDFVYFTADETTFDQSNGNVELTGNVEIVQDDGITIRKIRAQHIRVFTEQQLLVSEGPTEIEDEKGLLTMNGAKFDLASKTMLMEQVSGNYYPIRVLSTQSTEAKNGRYVLRKANLTCCDREEPHYNLYVGKATITPGKRLVATNAVIKFGKIPVFYLPFVYRSLNTDRIITTYLDFDQSDNTGFGLLTSTVLSLKDFRAKANLDYYTKSGIGYGGELAFNDPSKFRGALEAYYIYDKNIDKNRWGVNGGYWWEVKDSSDSLNNNGKGSLYFSQLELRQVSDADFNDDFFRSRPYVVSPDQLARASAVRQTNNNTFRVSYSKRSALNPDDKTFSNSEEILPKVDLIFNPFTFGNTGIVNNLNFDFTSKKVEDLDAVQYLGARWTSSKSLKLHPNFTLTPKLFYDQQAVLDDPNNNDENSFIGRYGTDINLRSDLITGFFDIGYRYTRKMQSSNLPQSPQNPKEGEEENLFYVQNFFVPTPNLFFRLHSGFDINDNSESWSAKDRMAPLTAELSYFNPTNGLNFFSQNVYDFKDGNKSFILDTTLPTKSGSYASFGMANYSSDRDSFLFTTKFMISPKNFTWRADMGIDFKVEKDSFYAYAKHIRVYKDFHDFGIMVGVRDRNQNLSFTFRINVYCGKTEKKAAGKEVDEYWYPWRDQNLVRDNF